MNKILFIQYPSLSHLNASFKIAKILKKNGYEIFYFMPRVFQQHIQNNDFHFYVADTFPFGVDADSSFARQMDLKYDYFDKLKNKSNEMFFHRRKDELQMAINKIMPTVVVADTFAGSDFILLYEQLKMYQIKFFYLETMLSSTGTPHYPYLDSKALPNQKIRIQLEHLCRISIRLFKQLIYKIGYLGQDEYSILHKKIKESTLPTHYQVDTCNFFDFAFKKIPSLLTSPIELEFFNQPLNGDQHYLGLFVDKTRKDGNIDPDLTRILDKRRPLIYISFGTVFGEYRATDILYFLKKLNTIAGQLDEMDFVLSLGRKQLDKKQLDLLSNIHVFSYVPQLWILQHAKIFITHGGLNSVKEGIAASIPLLVYPIDIDQIGNARKVAARKIGLYGSLKKDTTEMIKTKIKQLMYQNDFRNYIESMRLQINNNYNEEELVLNAINQYGHVR